MNSITSSQSTLKSIIYNLLDSGYITPETTDDLITAVNNSPSLDIY